ncbi:MAG: TlpA disulfide reductase family protein [Candidatus Omnitrophota bacterium]|nr:TlpA disulfide reductase family protein [Candidatus Omnitrophota bacterium]
MKISKRILFFLLVCFLFCGRGNARAEQLKAAPDFKLSAVGGSVVSLSSFKDKQSVLLFFWATWCPYCRDELRALNEKYAELQKDGIGVLAINIGESPERIARFMKNYALNFPVLLDANNDVAYDYVILGIPQYVLIDKAGYIVSYENRYIPRETYKELLKN